MKRKRSLAILVALIMVLTMMPPGVFAQSDKVFSDMPGNWSTTALNKAVENGLLKGYQQGDKLLIKPEAPIKRAELAAVVNRAFGAEKKADMTGVGDVPSSAWYADDMAKAVAMGTFMKDSKMRPEDGITRQEAFAVLARAFKVAFKEGTGLGAFSDADKVAPWAKDSLAAMANAGYVQGSGGKLNPAANISRAEFAVVMDNLVKQYVAAAGEVTNVAASGNLLVRSAGTILKDITVNGDLIIADGVGEGNVTLDNVIVKGRTVIRGGGINSIIIKGNSDLGTVIVYKVDGKVRVSVQGKADVDVVYIEDGCDDVIVEGRIGVLEVLGDVTVTANNATIESLLLSGDGAWAILGFGTTVKNVVMSGKNTGITAQTGSTVDKVTITGDNAKVEGSGNVEAADVAAGTAGASVTTPGTIVTGEAATGTPKSSHPGGGGDPAAVVETGAVGVLNATLKKGANLWEAQLTISDKLGTGNQFVCNFDYTDLTYLPVESDAPEYAFAYPADGIIEVDDEEYIGQYITVFEVKIATNKVVKCKSIKLTEDNVNLPPSIAVLNAKLEKGTNLWETKLTISDELGAGNQFIYAFSDTEVTYLPEGLDDVDGTVVAPPSVTIAVDEEYLGRYIIVMEIDASKKVLKFKCLNLTEENVKYPEPPSALNAALEKGTNLSETKLKIFDALGAGNKFAYVFSDSEITSLPTGFNAPKSTVDYPASGIIEIDDVDHIGRYIVAFEVNIGTNRVVKFKSIKLTEDNVNLLPPVAALNATLEKGTNLWKTRLTISDELGAGNRFIYDFSDSEIIYLLPGIDDVDGTVVVPPSVTIAVDEEYLGRYIIVMEVDGSGTVLKFKCLELTADNVNVPTPAAGLNATLEKGPYHWATKLNITDTAAPNNRFAYRIEEVKTSYLSKGSIIPAPIYNYPSDGIIGIEPPEIGCYILVLELDNSNKVAKFKSIELTIYNVNTPSSAGTLDAAASAGTVLGTTKVDISDVLGAGNKFIYTIGSSEVKNLSVLSTETGTDYTSGNDINGVNEGEWVTVYEVNAATDKVVKYKSIRLTADKIKAPDPAGALDATASAGIGMGTTKVDITDMLGAGNKFIYTISLSKVTGLTVEDTETGTDYTSGNDIDEVSEGEWVTVYEVNAVTHKVVKYKSIEIAATMINTTSPSQINATLAKGPDYWKSILTITDTPASGNKFVWWWVYADLTDEILGDTVSDSAQDCPADGVITAGAGLLDAYLSVYEVNASNKIIRYKCIKYTEDNLNIPPFASGLTVTVASKSPAEAGKVMVTITPAVNSEPGHKIYYRVTDEDPKPYYVGTCVVIVYAKEVTAGTSPFEVEATDGQYVSAVETKEIDGDEYVTRWGKSGPTDDGI